MTDHAVEDEGKYNMYSSLVGVQTCTAPMEIGVVLPQETGIQLSHLGIYPKDYILGQGYLPPHSIRLCSNRQQMETA